MLLFLLCTRKRLLLWLSCWFGLTALVPIQADSAEKFYAVVEGLAPHVFISVLVTNSMHALPSFLGYLEGLDYPKDRISLWVRSDHNVDGTSASVNRWCYYSRAQYKSVDCHASYQWEYPTRNPYSKPIQRSKNKARLRQQALEAALTAGADYLLTLDVDCFLVNPKTLQLLMEQNKTIVAPMLDAKEDSVYSNFWMAKNKMNHNKDELYRSIVQRERIGSFSVPVVFGTVLIHLSSPYSENLVYHPPHPRFVGRVDDVLQFAFSAQSEGVDMHILNTEFFGHIMEEVKYKDINEASRKYFQFKLETLVNHPPIPYSSYTYRQKPIIKNAELRLDAVYVINLARRPERRKRMSAILDELGYKYTMFTAVDGKDLNDTYLEDELGIKYMDSDGNNHTMHKGQVGCFLSHYIIWKKMLQENQKTVLVLEDDVTFSPTFTKMLYHVLREARMFTPSWDFIYIGRNRADWFGREPSIKRARWLVKPAYSHFLGGYLLSSRGAQKLVDAKPFRNLLPADEFIPIMYGAHPRNDWLKQFFVRNLNVYSAKPLLIQPRKGHISDTTTADEFREKIQEEKMNEVHVHNQQRETVKKKALQRQIEMIKQKMRVHDEL